MRRIRISFANGAPASRRPAGSERVATSRGRTAARTPGRVRRSGWAGAAWRCLLAGRVSLAVTPASSPHILDAPPDRPNSSSVRRRQPVLVVVYRFGRRLRLAWKETRDARHRRGRPEADAGLQRARMGQRGMFGHQDGLRRARVSYERPRMAGLPERSTDRRAWASAKSSSGVRISPTRRKPSAGGACRLIVAETIRVMVALCIRTLSWFDSRTVRLT